MGVIMPLNVYERSNTGLKPREEHFSDAIGNSYILHTAQAYILFSQFLYFWPNRTESFESREKKKKKNRLSVSALSNSWKDWDFPPPSPFSVPHNWDTLEIFGQTGNKRFEDPEVQLKKKKNQASLSLPFQGLDVLNGEIYLPSHSFLRAWISY